MDNDWINCVDRLPDNVFEVIIGGECCEACYNIDIGFCEDGEWYLQGGRGMPSFLVTHWMPLPKPPQKKYYGQ